MNNYFARKKQWKNRGALFNKRRPKPSDYKSFDRFEESEEHGVLFVFNENVEDSTEDEVIQRRERNSTQSSQQMFLEKEVHMDDTLASLALRYGCSVAELKRVNNFLSDQELHGLRHIKVPIKPFSLLLELEDSVIDSSRCQILNTTEDKVSGVRNLSIGSSLLSDDGRSFLNAMDEDLERIRNSTCHYKASLEDVTAELTCKRFHPIVNDQCKLKKCNKYKCYAMIWIFVITTIIPLVIFLYIELHKDS